VEAARVIIQVDAGLMPGEPEEKFSRRWVITTAEWERALREDAISDEAHAQHAALLLMFRAAQADEYARLVRDPARFNWVRTEWTWM
jgi:hypothetical protein